MRIAGVDAFDDPRPFAWARWGLRAVAAMLLVCCALRTSQAGAQDDYLQREAKIKAAYLYKFIKYVEWPEECFADAGTPVVIGALGDDPVNPYLRLIAKNRKVGARALAYLPIAKPEQATLCHILFVGQSVDDKSFAAVMSHIRDAPVLLVGEWPDFAKTSGVIGFVVADNHVRLEISLETAKVRNLKISSQLAKLAQVVD